MPRRVAGIVFRADDETPPTAAVQLDCKTFPQRPSGAEDPVTAPPEDLQRLGSAAEQADLDDVPANVPRRRELLAFTPHNYKPWYIDWDSGKWKRAPDQTASIDLSLMLELYIAADLKKKILRLSSRGSGFSVGKVRKNEWHERGVFQDQLAVEVGPVKPGILQMGGNSPETENKDATFTSTSSTTIKVTGKASGSEKGGGGEGGLEGSYTVTNSVSTVLSDFEVYNYSDGKDGKWSWEMSKMGGGKARYTYPYDDPKSLICWNGDICPVAGIARSKLFPALQAYWYAPADFQGIVPFELRLLQRTGYVVDNVFIAYAQPAIPPTTITRPFRVSFADSSLEPRP